MSYEQAMKWNRKHPKGTRQPVIMSTSSGFWPSGAYLEDYFEYRAECEKVGIVPAECEDYYHNGRWHDETLQTAKDVQTN